jgi:hypothetical protein
MQSTSPTRCGDRSELVAAERGVEEGWPDFAADRTSEVDAGAAAASRWTLLRCRFSAMAVDDATTWKEFNDTVNMTAAEL